jgi:nitric oxide reductase large subunit
VSVLKNNLSRILLGTELLAAMLILGAVLVWAPVCNGLLTLENGTMVHMKCFYTAQTSLVLAILLIASVLIACFSKTDHKKMKWMVILIGIMLILNTFESMLGIGICKKTDMACHATAFWIRWGGIIAILSGLLDMGLNNNKSKSIIFQ